MSAFKAIVVEDESKAAAYLIGLIESRLPEINVVGLATSVDEGVELINKHQPALVFLDIELQTGTGFDLLTKLDRPDFHVIFTTAHEKYALSAIKFAALDYLIKPIDPEELKQAIAIFKRKKKEDEEYRGIKVLLENFSKSNKRKKIAIYTNKGLALVEISKIIYCKSDGPYTELHTTEGKLVSSRHLKEFEELLIEADFFRVHKSYLVNLNEINQYVKSEGGHLLMSNGASVDVSGKKKDELLKLIEGGCVN